VRFLLRFFPLFLTLLEFFFSGLFWRHVTFQAPLFLFSARFSFPDPLYFRRMMHVSSPPPARKIFLPVARAENTRADQWWLFSCPLDIRTFAPERFTLKAVSLGLFFAEPLSLFPPLSPLGCFFSRGAPPPPNRFCPSCRRYGGIYIFRLSLWEAIPPPPASPSPLFCAQSERFAPAFAFPLHPFFSRIPPFSPQHCLLPLTDFRDFHQSES